VVVGEPRAADGRIPVAIRRIVRTIACLSLVVGCAAHGPERKPLDLYLTAHCKVEASKAQIKCEWRV
jgi:hypothetical protein